MPETKEAKGKILINWRFPEHPGGQREKSWYVVAIIIGLALIIYAIWAKNYLFALIIMMAGVTIIAQGLRKPRNLNFYITEEGIAVEDKFYHYADLKNFWIIYEPTEVKSLYFSFKATLKPTLIIPLQNQNPLLIREKLLIHLTEDTSKDKESFSDGLARKLKI